MNFLQGSKQIRSLLSLLAMCVLWLAIGWTLRGYFLGPDPTMVEQARQHLLREYAGDTPASRELSYAAIRGMLGRSGDPHAALLEPAISARFWDDFTGEAGVVGVIAGEQNGEMVVGVVLPGDPADLAGLKVGDVILSVDGVVFDENTTEAEASMLIRGEVGTPAHMVVRRGEQILSFEPVRQERAVVSASMLDGDIAFLAQYKFTTNAAQIVKQELQALLTQQPRGIIWDLRLNGGGSMETAQQVLSYFVPDGLLFLAELKDGQMKQYPALGNAIAADLPLVVLIGPQTYSSGETAAASIRERGRGLLVGETTHGKGTIQTTVPLAEGSMLQYTVAKWLSPSGKWFEGRGVSPDIALIDDPDTPQDEVLDQAVAIILGGGAP